jgi:hypothetical protein
MDDSDDKMSSTMFYYRKRCNDLKTTLLKVNEQLWLPAAVYKTTWTEQHRAHKTMTKQSTNTTHYVLDTSC